MNSNFFFHAKHYIKTRGSDSPLRLCSFASLREKIIMVMVLAATLNVQAQDTVRYTGRTLVNVDYHHGELVPAVGVHNIQVFRANRQDPEAAGGNNWTYNHAPMLAYWNDRFYLQYLANPVGEHVPPGQTLILTSKDGYNWSKPEIVFPPYKIPDGISKEGYQGLSKNLYAVNHQRMGFYVSKTGRLLTLAYYGIVLGPGDDPNDGKGIGRVVREVYKDGSYSPIYFIRYNKTWDQKKSDHPFFTSSKDKGFVEACNELLATPLMMQQWVEEADRDDPLIPLKKELKAFSYYHLPDGRVVGLWKNALTSITNDEGQSWAYSPLRAPQFVNSNAKIWGQKTSDGSYATVYNPSEFRWPLAISVSKDGLDYTNLLLVNGEITSMRYGGAYKSYGPQYVRGIEEGNGLPPDGNMWVTYSMNKEDIWVAKTPVPVLDKVTTHPDEVFSKMPAGQELKYWNYNSGLWAPVSLQTMADGSKALSLKDWDPFDYAKAERVVPSSKLLVTEFEVTALQTNHGLLDIEFQDAKGRAGVRLSFDSTGTLVTKAGYRNRNLMKYVSNRVYNIRVELNTGTRFYTVHVDGKALPQGLFFAPLENVSRVVFRTGPVRRFPDADTPTDQMYDLPNAGKKAVEAGYLISSFKTSNR